MPGIIQHVYSQTVADGTATSVVRPSDWNSVHNQSLTLGGNTLGASTIGGTNIVLAGGNNVTLSADTLNGSIIISGPNAATQSVQAQSVDLLGNTAGVSSVTGSMLFLAGGNNVTLSANANSITISGPNTVTQSNQQLSLYAVSNTTLATSSTGNASALSFEGAGGVSIGVSNGSVVISGATGGDADGYNIISLGGNTAGVLTTYLSATMVLEGGNNITLSQSSNSVTISAANQSVQPLSVYAESQSFGTSSGTIGQNLSVSGGGIVSVAASNGGLVINATTASQSVQALSMYVESQSFGTSSGTVGQNLSVSGSGIISAAVSNGGLVLNATTSQSVQPVSYYVESQSFGTSSGTVGQNLSISGSGIISVAASNGGLIFNATTAAQSVQALSAYVESQSFGTSSGTIGQNLSISGSGIVSVAVSNGGLVLNATTVVQTNQTIGAYATGAQTTAQTSSTTFDARSLSFSGAGGVSVGMSTTGAGGPVVVISGATGGGGTNLSAYAVSNTTLATSNTLAFSAFSVEGAGNVSVGVSNGSLVISGATAAGNTQVSAYAVSNTTLSTSTPVVMSAFSIEGAGGVSVGASNGSIIASAPNQTYLIAGNNISLSSNSNSITIAGINSPSTVTLSQFEPLQFGNNSSASTLGQSSIYFQHFEVPQPLQFCRIDRLVSFTQNAAVSGSSNHTGTRSNTWQYIESVALYTRGAGTNSTALYSLTSQSWSIGLTESVSITTTATNAVGISQSGTFGFIGNIGTNGGSTSSTFNSNSQASGASSSTSYSSNLSNLSGTAILNIPFGSTILSPGDYWLALLASYTAGGSGGTSTNLGTLAQIVLTNLNAGLKMLGQTATATSNTLIPGNGVGNAQTAALPSSIPIASISNNSNVSLYFNLMNVSL